MAIAEQIPGVSSSDGPQPKIRPSLVVVQGGIKTSGEVPAAPAPNPRDITLQLVQDYLTKRHRETLADKMPVPTLNSFRDSISNRRRFGHVFVGMMFEFAGQPIPPTPADKAPLQRVFARLDAFRQGAEGMLNHEARDTVQALVEGIDSPVVRVGRQIIDLLQSVEGRQPAYNTAAEAFLAVQLHALGAPAERMQ